ncbi:hypothetical protein J2847_006459 [Azospirillum agricola]|uniref:hypothetical protein n=1 Tax=Azospirillum agricola TaxID=1720247 RepID=UPI001AEA1691|nr:hypothetical protein [Azospirillum agricola]MBP2233124.1 hypothetical protein [Azospirillum agricola]
METLPELWKKRQAAVRRIERATQPAPPALAAETHALTVAVAGHPIGSDADIDVKLTLARELAAHAPDAALLLKLLDTLQEGLPATRSARLPGARVAELISAKKANKANFPL